MKVFLDFETRSELDLKKCGVSAYARHSSTEALCLAFQIGESPVALWAGGVIPPGLLAAIKEQAEFHAHNAAFEKAIWRHVMVAKHQWPEIADDRWHCTAARCAALALPRSLDGAAKALGGLSLQKDKAGAKIMKRLTKPNAQASFTDEAALHDYCKQDVRVEKAIHEATLDLSEMERYTWLLDQLINDRGIPVDRETIAHALALEEKHQALLLAELAELTGGEVTTGRQVERLLTWLNQRGVNIGDLQSLTIESALKKELPAEVRRVLEIRQELAKASSAKLATMLAMADEDGRVRGSHLYHGASPGRWTGKGVQFQNIPRGFSNPADNELAISAIASESPELVDMLFGGVAQTLSSLIRPMVKAPEGKRFIICDFAGIEARVLAWLADQLDLVKVFEDGGDVYKVMAGKIYGKSADDVTKAERQLGKVAILGLGYQMGAGKFVSTAWNYGITITDEEAQEVVDVYRETYSRIKGFWSDLQRAAIEAVTTGKQTSVGKIAYKVAGRWLFCRLPSGRKIAYCDPLVNTVDTPWGKKPQLSYMTVDAKTKKWVRESTYGGKLCENIVQGTARDFLACGMFRCEDAGYPVILHVHDEVVCEVPNGFGSVAEVERLITTLPKWGIGCPLAAEGFESERYRK